MNLYESTWEHIKRKLFVFSVISLFYLFHCIVSFQEYSWCHLNWRHFESSAGILFLISILINMGLPFLPLFTFFTAGKHKVSTKLYLFLCCYFCVLPIGLFVSKECKENSGTVLWMLNRVGYNPVLVRCSVLNWRIISQYFLYLCTEFYIACIFLNFHIATLFPFPHVQKLFVLALFELSCEKDSASRVTHILWVFSSLVRVYWWYVCVK